MTISTPGRTRSTALSRTGFTLVELLVVIAIVAILAAVLFPVFAQAKAAGKRSTALSNLRQIGAATLLYGGDNGDTFAQLGYTIGTRNGVIIPGSGSTLFTFYDAMTPYLKSTGVYSDPADPKAIDWSRLLSGLGLHPLGSPGGVPPYAGFMANFALFEDPALGPTLFEADSVVNASQLDAPAYTVMFYSARYVLSKSLNPDAPEGGTPDYHRPSGAFGPTHFPGVARHLGSVPTIFADAHARALPARANLPAKAPNPYFKGGAIDRCYTLPYDLQGIPGFVAEPRL